jgi:type II secretory pathway pseudopilin PulG
MTRRHQSGSALTLVMLGILAAGVLATIAYGSYYQIARGTQDTMNRTQSAALLTQAVYALATEAATAGDIDADGVTEPTAGAVAFTPIDGFEVPATSGAPKTDAWGSKIKYCPWDNGSTNTSAGRLTGVDAALQTSLQIALISAGPDKAFATTCAQVLAGGAAAQPNGDDGIRTLTVAQLNQGVGGTYFYGDPVANVSALPATDAPAGKMRVAKDTQIPYLWNGSSWAPLNAGAWLMVPVSTTPATSCAPYPPGTLARDSADVLYLCRAAQTWKTVIP